MSRGTPKTWASTPLASIAEVRLGRQRSPVRATGPHMRPYMRAANVTWQGINATDVKEMDFTPAEYETYRLRRGDILLAEASGSPDEVGKPAIWSNEVPGACFQNTLIRVRSVDEQLVPFLHLHLFKDARTGEFAAASRGVGIHHLGAEALFGWEVTLPPLPEQHRIVEAIESYFTRLDDAVATLERVQRNLKRHRASVLKAAVEGRLVPTEAELARAERRGYEPASVLLEHILVERRRRWEASGYKGKYQEPVGPDISGLPVLPEGWCWASMEQLTAESLIGLVRSRQEQRSESRGVRYLKMNCIGVDGSLDASDLPYVDATDAETARYDLREGDLLFNTRNSAELVGKTALVQHSLPHVVFNNNIMRIRFVDSVSPSYIAAYALSPVFRMQIDRVKRATTSVAAVYGKDLWHRACALPPRPEQARIAQEIDRVISTVASTEVAAWRAARQCALLRQGILKWAFEGKLADQDPNDEPASALLERIKAERAIATPPKKNRRLANGRARKTA
jgi:type I restriction enzyme S subunit